MLPDNGFIRGKAENMWNAKVKYTPIESFHCLYGRGDEYSDRRGTAPGRGNTGKAVRASCSIPGVFNPYIGDKTCVDGGG